MSKRPLKNRHFKLLSNKSHNRNDPGTDEKQNHYVDLPYQHSQLGSFTRSVTGFEQHGNYFSKFTFPSLLAFGGKKQESSFLWWRCQWNSNTGHQLQEFLGLQYTLLRWAKTQKHRTDCSVAQDYLNHVKHTCHRSFWVQSMTTIS